MSRFPLILSSCLLVCTAVYANTQPFVEVIRLTQPSYVNEFDEPVQKFSRREIQDALRFAKLGYANSQYNVATMYYTKGESDSAHRWYHSAASRGHAMAQYNLGVMYYNGDVIARDFGKAADWFARSARRGFPAAQFQLGRLYFTGEGVAPDPAMEVYWYREAAERGYPLAQYNLGVLYHLGEGVPKDNVEAYAWFVTADSLGLRSDAAQAVILAELSSADRERAARLASRYASRYGAH